jgi:hypothetical protein
MTRTILQSLLCTVGILAGASACAAGADKLSAWAGDPRISDAAAIDCVVEAELLRQLIKGARDFNAIASMPAMLEISSVFASFRMVLDTRHGEGARMQELGARLSAMQGDYLSFIRAESYARATERARAQVKKCKRLLKLQ